VSKYAKAIVGAIIAGLGPLYLALDDGRMSGQEWVTVAAAFLTALGVVWGVPNVDKGVNLSQATDTADFVVTDDTP
jgi:hypothetical protein